MAMTKTVQRRMGSSEDWWNRFGRIEEDAERSPTHVEESTAPWSRKASPVGSVPQGIGWLHLSDAHVGVDEQGFWPNLREEIYADLERMHERSGPWQVVFFTGDLVQRGAEGEFRELERRLDQLWEHLARLGSNPVLVAVPGNHDLKRPPSMGAGLRALRQWATDSELRHHFWEERPNEYLSLVEGAFAPYADWAKRDARFVRAGARWGQLPGDFSAVVEHDGLRLGVVGLNTAFLQLAEGDFAGKLDADVRQLHAACGGDGPAWASQQDINFLLSHHPPSWLDTTRALPHWRSEIAPPGRFAIHLHGHLHEPGAVVQSEGGGAPRHRLQGASLFGLEWFVGTDGAKMVRLHGYAAGRVELLDIGQAGYVGTADVGSGGVEQRDVARVRIWPRRLVTKHSGRRVLERDPEMELDPSEAITWMVPISRPRRVRDEALSSGLGTPEGGNEGGVQAVGELPRSLIEPLLASAPTEHRAPLTELFAAGGGCPDPLKLMLALCNALDALAVKRESKTRLAFVTAADLVIRRCIDKTVEPACQDLDVNAPQPLATCIRTAELAEVLMARLERRKPEWREKLGPTLATGDRYSELRGTKLVFCEHDEEDLSQLLEEGPAPGDSIVAIERWLYRLLIDPVHRYDAQRHRSKLRSVLRFARDRARRYYALTSDRQGGMRWSDVATGIPEIAVLACSEKPGGALPVDEDDLATRLRFFYTEYARELLSQPFPKDHP